MRGNRVWDTFTFFLLLLAVFLGKLTKVAKNNTQQISHYHYHHHQQQKQSKALPTYMQY